MDSIFTAIACIITGIVGGAILFVNVLSDNILVRTIGILYVTGLFVVLLEGI